MLLKNYINKDIYKTSGAILVVLILIFISSRFIKYIQLAVDGTISAQAVFELLALQIPSVAGFLIPLSFFIAILLTFGRLYSENELVVVHSLGLGQKDLARMLMPLVLSFAVIAGSLSTFLTPWAVTQTRTIMAEQAAQAKLGVFSAGRFRENSNKDGIVFVERKTNTGMIEGVFSVARPLDKELETSQDDQLMGLANDLNYRSSSQLNIRTAARGRQWSDPETGLDYLLLEKGQYSEYDQLDDKWQITDFARMYSKITQDDSVEVKNTTKSRSTIDLFSSLTQKDWAEIHWRLGAPISIPIICLLAVPLSRTQPRKGKFSRLMPSIMIYLIYVLLMMYSRRLIESGQIPGVLGFWWIHLGMLAIVYQFYKPTKIRRLRPSKAATKGSENEI